MSDPFLAQITMFAGNFNPRGWLYCNGSLLAISQNSALFSLLGTIYGGDGRVTFALPDLRGRVPIGSEGGSGGPGLTPRPLGSKGGEENHVLSIGQMPNHTHTLRCVDDDGSLAGPKGNNLANASSGTPFSGDDADASMKTGTGGAISSVGGGQSFGIMQPFLAINFIIATQGTFPSRN